MYFCQYSVHLLLTLFIESSNVGPKPLMDIHPCVPQTLVSTNIVFFSVIESTYTLYTVCTPVLPMLGVE